MNINDLNNYLLHDLDDRIEEFEDAIDIYPSVNSIGLNNVSISGNITVVSGTTNTSIDARNADLTVRTFSAIRERSNVVPFIFTQYSSGSVNMGLEFVRGGGQEISGTHLDVISGRGMGVMNCRPVVSGSSFPVAVTARYGVWTSETQTSTARGNSFQVFLTPSGSISLRKVFNIDSNGDTTLGTTSKIPLFDFWTKNINVTGNILPMVDDAFDLGSASLRFNDAYVANGVTTISDPSYKNSLQPLSFSAIDFVNSINVYQGKYNFSKSNRWHLFFNSHEIKEYFQKLNLDYGIYTVDNGIVSLRYHEFIPILQQNIKELNCQVKELNKVVTELYSKVTTLEERNEIFYKKFYKWFKKLF